MRQFLKYELKYGWKDFLLSYLLIIGSIIVLGIFILIVKDSGTTTDFQALLYSNIIMIIVGAIIASITLFIINLVKSLYNDIFSDTGYLTLSIPQPVEKLLLSKIVSNLIWVFLYIVCAIVGVIILTLTLTSSISSLFEDLQMMLEELKFFGPGIPFYLITYIVDILVTFVLLLLSFTLVNLGKMKKAKVVMGILIYMGCSYVLSIFQSAVGLLSFGLVLDGTGGLDFTSGSNSGGFIMSGFNEFAYALNIPMLIFNLGICVGLFFLVRYLIKNYLELE